MIHTDLVRSSVCHVHIGPLRLVLLTTSSVSIPTHFGVSYPREEKAGAQIQRHRGSREGVGGKKGSIVKSVVVEALSAAADHFRRKGPLLKRFGLFRDILLAMTDTQIKSTSIHQMKLHI